MLCVDVDQHKEEEKKELTWVLKIDLCMCAGEVDAFVLGHTLRVRVDVDKCKGKTKKKKKKKPTCSLGKLAADTQMCCVCMQTQMSIKKGQQKNKKTYLEIMGWGRVAC